VILRDNSEAGLHVASTGRAVVVNATIARNGTGIRAEGETKVRNTLVTANDTGMAATEAGQITSVYSDVFGNRVADLQNVQRGANDLAVAVAFESAAGPDLRLRPAQPTTDRGDPSDEYDNEPGPNGARINIGAYGNTVFAELSASIPPNPDGGATGTDDGGATGTADGGATGTDAVASSSPPDLIGPPSSSCALAARGSGPPAGSIVIIAVAMLLRRRRPPRPSSSPLNPRRRT
jgi:hypothetical protein